MRQKPRDTSAKGKGRSISFRVWFVERGKDLLGKGGAEILRNIAETHSISKTAKRLARSYRQLWGQIREMEQSYGEPLLKRFKGGVRGGGGAELTEEGKTLLKEYEKISNYVESLLKDENFWEAIGLKLSARNKLRGRIISIEKDGVVAKIGIELTTPTTITSVITREAAEDLDLKEGDEVEAVVKSTEVLISKEG